MSEDVSSPEVNEEHDVRAAFVVGEDSESEEEGEEENREEEEGGEEEEEVGEDDREVVDEYHIDDIGDADDLLYEADDAHLLPHHG